MTRTAIISALPGELKPFVKKSGQGSDSGESWHLGTRNGIHFWAKRNEQEEWIAACAGTGQAAATRAFAALEDGGPIDLVFSIGWAGALTPSLVPGSAHNVAGVIDTRTGERFRCDAGAGDLWLATTPTVAGEKEKLRLAASYNAALVDMEAAAIARLAAQREIPFYAIKGVSDGLHDKVPDFNRFITPQGQFQMLQFALFAALRPIYWPALLRMGENSSKASQSIAESLLAFLA